MGVSPMSGTAVPAVSSTSFTGKMPVSLTAKSLHDPRSGMAVVRLQAAVNCSRRAAGRYW